MSEETFPQVHVVVDNVHEIGTAKTIEVEPEHFVFRTVTLAAGITGIQQILNLDPQRKDALLLSVDAAAILCHSNAQAMSAANQITGFTDPDGSFIPQNQVIALKGTAAVWAVCQTATRITLIINRRGNA